MNILQLIPARVRYVSVSLDLVKTSSYSIETPFPAARFTPFEEFPSSAAVPHHCGRCPHDVGSCRDRENAEALSSMSTRANRSSHTTSLQVPRHLGDLGRDIRSRWGSLMQNTPEGVPPWVLVP
jgi:hypothetical protein